ncbi:MAG: glycoside hydrolase [Planctomycetota bacterium]
MALAFSASAVAQSVTIETGPSSRQQTFEGWGTSLAWWANEAGGWSEPQADALVELLFDDVNNLGLTYARYNIGGGQNPALGPIPRPGSNVAGWVPQAPSSVSDTSTWQWDYSADATQRLILDKALQHGVTKVEAFSNSAPWWMTISQDVTGATTPGASNLATARFDEFAYYLGEVVSHFETSEGIRFNALAPLNEPGSGFWTGGGNQEGMNIQKGAEQAMVYDAVATELASRGLTPLLVGPEETSVTDTIGSWNAGGFGPAHDLIDQINTHTYPFRGGSDGAVLGQLQSIAASAGKKVYANEFGTGSGALDGGIELARRVTADLTNLQASGWTYWQALEDNNGSGWGLLIEDFTGSGESPVARHQYQVLKQFSSHIRPGSHILTDTDADTLAAYDPRTNTTALVLTNQGTGNLTRVYDLSDQSPEYSRLIRTSGTEGYQSLGGADVNGSQVSLIGAGTSVTTVVIHHNANLLQNSTFALGGAAPGGTAIAGWQAVGDTAFWGFINNGSSPSGAGVLYADNAQNAGELRHAAVGDGLADLSGVAYEFSLDVLFQNQGASNYDAETFLRLEFLGQDGQTLTYDTPGDFETVLEPGLRTGSSAATDSVYRLFRSERFVAPAGTRYVRPVVGYRDVQSGSTDWVYVDNAYLHEVHPAADGRQWQGASTGLWEDDANWLQHALVAKNDDVYFGDSIQADATVLLTSNPSVRQLSFFSDSAYRLFSATSVLTVGSPSGGMVESRRGDHDVTVATVLSSDVEARLLPGASLTFDAGLDLDGHTLTKVGGGSLHLDTGFTLGGGRLATYSSASPLISLGLDAVLDGDLELLAAPGEAFAVGDAFEVIGYQTGFTGQFDAILLPALASGLSWNPLYGATSLTLSVVATGDFNDDGQVDADDIDLLVAAIQAGSTDSLYDLDGQSGVGESDLTHMITVIKQTSFGDFNLDGVVDLLDFDLLAQNFGQTGGWGQGNGNTDASIDLLDFDLLAQNFGSAGPSTVPEPGVAGTLSLATALACSRRRRPAPRGGEPSRCGGRAERLGGTWGIDRRVAAKANPTHASIGREARSTASCAYVLGSS